MSGYTIHPARLRRTRVIQHEEVNASMRSIISWAALVLQSHTDEDTT